MLYKIYVLCVLFSVASSKEILFDENCSHVQSESWLAMSPWLASIQAMDLKSGLIFSLCMGTLINHRYVTTPAVCVQNADLSITHVQLGIRHVHNYTLYTPIQLEAIESLYKIKKKVIHPLYKHKNTNNIALLRLERFVTYTEYIQPICLPFKKNIPAIGSKLYTSIWDKFKPFFASFPRMKSNVVSILTTNATNEHFIHSLELENATSKVCNSRFGAPLTFNHNNRSYLFGILLRKAKCDSDHPHVYLNVFNYLNWIEENVDSNYDRCTTPDNQTSRCIPLDDCPILLHIFANPKQKYLDYLIEYICSEEIYGGFQVCCPTYINSTELQADSTNLHLLSDKRFCGYQHRDDYPSNDLSIALDEFPWLATIQAMDSNNKQFSMCSGSLIHRQYVLTSAFCVFQSKKIVSVRLGEYNILNKTDCSVAIPQYNLVECSEYQDFNIEDIIVHPFYNSWTYSNDLALIRLNSTVLYSGYIRPICLPISSLFKSPHIEDTLQSTSFTTPKFWGTDYEKKKLFLSLIPNHVCEYKHRLTEYQMCVEPKEAPTDRFMSCYDDEGAPSMIANKKGQWTLQGIATERKSFCDVIHPIVHLKVAAYLPWIQENIKN